MLFHIITSSKHRKSFEFLVYLLTFTFILTFNGCFTTYKETVKAENYKTKPEYEIVNVIMKNGLVINLRNKQARYYSKYEDKKNVILYLSIGDTTKLPGEVFKYAYKKNIIELKDVLSVTIEKEEAQVGLTILATLGMIVGALALIALIVIATKESCPFIYSFDGEKYIFDGEPYGGAIAEGLKKTDYSRLEHLKPIDGKYKLLMRNEADETQYTDEMKLLVIDHPMNTEVAPDVNGNMTVFNRVFPPISVTDENGKDITAFFSNRDNIQWQSDMPIDTGYAGKNLKHDLILKFPKPVDAKKVKLLINAGTALWGGYMIKGMLNLRGNKVDKWYENINNKGTELLRLYQFIEREELYVLKANVLENDRWITKGLVTAGGPFIDEDRIVELNIENVTGDSLYINFSPPFGFWKFDFAGVIYESTIAAEVKELPISYAIDQEGTDLTKALNKIDGKYYIMPDSTYTANINFEATAQKENTSRSLFLKTNGYYDIHLKKDKPEQTELIEKILNTPGLILEISVKEYVKHLRSLGLLDK
jgi:hypothetical protein